MADSNGAEGAREGKDRRRGPWDTIVAKSIDRPQDVRRHFGTLLTLCHNPWRQIPEAGRHLFWIVLDAEDRAFLAERGLPTGEDGRLILSSEWTELEGSRAQSAIHALLKRDEQALWPQNQDTLAAERQADKILLAAEVQLRLAESIERLLAQGMDAGDLGAQLQLDGSSESMVNLALGVDDNE